MYMKKTMYFWLMALLIGGLSIGVTSCKDDNKDDSGGGGGPEEQEVGPTQTPEADMAAQWLVNLTYMEEFTDDWASKTYEDAFLQHDRHRHRLTVIHTDTEHRGHRFDDVDPIARGC